LAVLIGSAADAAGGHHGPARHRGREAYILSGFAYAESHRIGGRTRSSAVAAGVPDHAEHAGHQDQPSPTDAGPAEVSSSGSLAQDGGKRDKE
jgi:hypothetical protein